jgi:hypothetical protein
MVNSSMPELVFHTIGAHHEGDAMAIHALDAAPHLFRALRLWFCRSPAMILAMSLIALPADS